VELISFQHKIFPYKIPQKCLPESEIDGSALAVLCLKIQIPSTKLQINLKFQYSITKTFQDKALFGFSNLGLEFV
jgi:hypothetical protein